MTMKDPIYEDPEQAPGQSGADHAREVLEARVAHLNEMMGFGPKPKRQRKPKPRKPSLRVIDGGAK